MRDFNLKHIMHSKVSLIIKALASIRWTTM